MKHPFIYLISILLCINIQIECCNGSAQEKAVSVSIPVAGNSFIINNISRAEDIITESGITGWTDSLSIIRTFFRIEQPGTLTIALRIRVISGSSVLQANFGIEKKNLTIKNISFDTVTIGTIKIDSPGYQWIELQGKRKSSPTFAEVSDIIISGSAAEGKVFYVKDDFYFGRRGPSVHLNYETPPEAGDITWFYNEITIPEGNDIQGSYFMANGFAFGYFGIQVNSDSERRILFSVWSPYQTDKPADIPDEYKIILLKKGPDVITHEFGDEGSGGQSYLKYFWKTGTTYRFLLKGEPSINNSTDFTAYFFAPEIKKWKLVASFRRPKTTSYLTRLYSFLENFIPETGFIGRKGLYSNQWVRNAGGKWFELTNAKFTADATARKDARLDYSGGIENGTFFLRNCGFFNYKTEMNNVFTRVGSETVPQVNFSELE